MQSVVASGLNAPLGLAVDSQGNLYIADTWNNRLVEETLSAGLYTQSVIATGLNSPQGVAVAASGKIYVTQSASSGVDEVQLANVDMGTVSAGIASQRMMLTFTFSGAGSIGSPMVVTQGASGLDFTDAGTGSCTQNGTSYVYSSGNTCTVNVTFTPRFAGARYGAVLLTDTAGNSLAATYLHGTGFGPQVIFPPGQQSTVVTAGPTNFYGIAIDGTGSLYLVDASHNQVLKETPFAGGYTQSVPIFGFNNPEGIALDGAGIIYVSDTFNHLVWKETPSGAGYTQTAIFPVGAQYPGALAVDGSGNVYIVDINGNRVLKETLSNGSYTQSTIGTSIYLPSGVAVDSAGDVYIAGANPSSPPGVNSGWVLKEAPSNGGYTQSVVATGFVATGGVTVDSNGNVYVSDYEGGPGFTGLFYKETPSGSTYSQSLVGNGLSRPLDAAIDGSGNIYIVTFGTGNIVKEDLSDAAAVRFAATAVGQTSSDSPQTVIIENSGNAAMNLPLPLQGTNPMVPSGFVVNDTASSACPLLNTGSPAPGVVAAGTSCDLTISFSPRSLSDTSGWVTYTYDGPNETSSSYQTVAIPLIAGGVHLTPTLTWTNPSSIVYGKALGGQQLNASANVPGAFAYSPAAGTILTVGSHTLSVSFTASDTADFVTVGDQVTIDVTQATPSISWAAPSAITYGAALSSTQLNASSTVAGTFSYSPAAGTVLSAGSQTLNVTFTPTDTTDYTTATASVPLTVNQATPAINWATPTSITYGTALGAAQLDASSTVAGSFVYSPAAGTVPGAGPQTLSVIFTPTDTTDYTTATATVTLTVNQATPAITWPTPAAITYGTALSGTQLNATANVAGTFSYLPLRGTVLAAGSQTLTAKFTPADTTDYAATSASVAVIVNKANATITWNTPSAIVYGTALSTIQLNASSTIAGIFVYNPATGTVLGAGSQTLSVNFTPTDGTDYVTANKSIQILVNQDAPTVAATPSSSSVTTSQALTVTVVVSGKSGNLTPSGTVTLSGGGYTSSTGTLSSGSYTFAVPANSLSVGNDALTVTYSGDTNYVAGTVKAFVTVTASPLTPTVNVTPAATSLDSGTALSVTALVTGPGVTPTGTVTLSGGGYTSSAGTLSGGSYIFNIPANSLTAGADL